MKDQQRALAYRWERLHVAPHDQTPIPFAQAKMVAEYVWGQEGLQFPPLVEPLPKNARRVGATGSRTRLRFPDQTYTWIVLHELGHALSATHEGASNAHGAVWAGLYIQLLGRYLKLNVQGLMWSAELMGLRVKLDAKPVFLE